MYSGLYERRPDTPFIFTNGRERKYNMAEQSLKEKTAKGLFWGGFSNGIQQLLNLLFGIIITRMLDSTDYGMIGMLAIFTAVANSIQESGLRPLWPINRRSVMKTTMRCSGSVF